MFCDTTIKLCNSVVNDFALSMPTLYEPQKTNNLKTLFVAFEEDNYICKSSQFLNSYVW